jgi:hypothetical protein
MLKHSRSRALLILLGIALATLTPTSPALAQPVVSARFAPQAALLARGAAVTVEVLYTCPVDSQAISLGIDVTQRVGSRTARGATSVPGSEPKICDGTQHSAVLAVSSLNGVPFRQGVAFGEGIFFVCDLFSSCVNLQFSNEFRIEK